jgi:hypothetical protein
MLDWLPAPKVVVPRLTVGDGDIEDIADDSE